MDLSFADASSAEAADIAALRTAVAERLTREHGTGHWSAAATERGVLRGLHAHSRILVARSGASLLGTLRLATKKPWAIDPAYFTAVRRPLYLSDMAVSPTGSGRGSAAAFSTTRPASHAPGRVTRFASTPTTAPPARAGSTPAAGSGKSGA
jgi:hypothetical protein